MRIYLCSITICAGCYCSAAHTDDLYIYRDQHGHQVFSDTPPINHTYRTSELTEIETVIWQKTQANKYSRTPKNKQRANRSHAQTQSQYSNKKQQCEKQLKKIQRLQKALKQKQKAAQFDRTKSKLRALRWEYQKSC